MILAELIEYLFQDLQMFIMCVGVHQEVVDVDDDVLQVAKYPLHQLLERGWTAEKSYGQSDPVELTLAWDRKSGERLQLFF